jgi:hypothetical protein
MILDDEMREHILRLRLPKEEAKEKKDCSDYRLYLVLHEEVQKNGLDSLPRSFQLAYKVWAGRFGEL